MEWARDTQRTSRALWTPSTPAPSWKCWNPEIRLIPNPPKPSQLNPKDHPRTSWNFQGPKPPKPKTPKTQNPQNPERFVSEWLLVRGGVLPLPTRRRSHASPFSGAPCGGPPFKGICEGSLKGNRFRDPFKGSFMGV